MRRTMTRSGLPPASTGTAVLGRSWRLPSIATGRGGDGDLAAAGVGRSGGDVTGCPHALDPRAPRVPTAAWAVTPPCAPA